MTNITTLDRPAYQAPLKPRDTPRRDTGHPFTCTNWPVRGDDDEVAVEVVAEQFYGWTLDHLTQLCETAGYGGSEPGYELRKIALRLHAIVYEIAPHLLALDAEQQRRAA
jgi:hypothetical protein